MPDLTEKIVRRYAKDVIETVAVLPLLVVGAMSLSRFLDIDLVLKFSLLERLLVAFAFAFIIGKVCSKLGMVVTLAVAWIFIQEDKLATIREGLNEFRYSIRLGTKYVNKRDWYITHPEIYRFIGKSESIRVAFDTLDNARAFWYSFLGMTIVGVMLPLPQEARQYVFAATLLSLIASVHASSKVNKYWGECAAKVRSGDSSE